MRTVITALACLAIFGLACNEQSSSRNSDTDDLTDEEYAEQAAMEFEEQAGPITDTPIGARSGIDFPQDWGDTFQIALIPMTADAAAAELVDAGFATEVASYDTIDKAIGAVGDNGSYFPNKHAVLVQLKDQSHTIWLYSGFAEERAVQHLSASDPILLFGYSDFAGAQYVGVMHQRVSVGEVNTGVDLRNVTGDFGGFLSQEMLDRAKADTSTYLAEFNAWVNSGADDYTPSVDLNVLLSDIMAELGGYVPVFGEGTGGAWTPRTAGGDEDVASVVIATLK